MATTKKGPEFYLLSGWTMMAESCPECQHPLYHDKRNSGKVVCANCDVELVAVEAKKETTVSAPAPVAQEGRVQILSTQLQPTSVCNHKHLSDPSGVIASTIEAVLGKMAMIQQRLSICSLSDVEEQKNLCKLIKMYTEILKALKKVQ